jgi:hypothetical protein
MTERVEKPDVDTEDQSAAEPAINGGVLWMNEANVRSSQSRSEAVQEIKVEKDGSVSQGEAIDNFPTFRRMHPLSDKERAEAVKAAADSLTTYVRGELPRIKADLERHKLSTSQIDELIKSRDAGADAVKPLQKALLSGDMKAVQKFLSEAKPEQLQSAVKLIQEHSQQVGSVLNLDIHEGNKLIVSESGSNKAVVIGGGKTDVIGVNKDGSYDFSKHFRGEDAGKELNSLTDSVLRSWGFGMQNPREFLPRPRPEELPFTNYIQVSPLDELVKQRQRR